MTRMAGIMSESCKKRLKIASKQKVDYESYHLIRSLVLKRWLAKIRVIPRKNFDFEEVQSVSLCHKLGPPANCMEPGNILVYRKGTCGFDESGDTRSSAER